jgi:hypothetical protein
MQTIQELADRFFDKSDHSSNVYNKRLCEQVREQIEHYVAEALKSASENAEIKYWNHVNDNEYDTVDKESILNAYPLDNIK